MLFPFRIGHSGHFQHHPQGIGTEGLLFILADPSIFQQQFRHGIRAVFADFPDILRILPYNLLQVPAYLAQEGLEGIGGNIPVDPVPFLVQFHRKGDDFFPDPGGPFVQFPQLDNVFPVFPAVPLHGLQQHFHRGGFIDQLQIPVVDILQFLLRNGQGGGYNRRFWLFRRFHGVTSKNKI